MKALVLALAVFASGAALAQGAAVAEKPKPHALVRADSGDVQVRNAAVAVETSVGAETGDTVIVSQGQATVTYDNGCDVKVTDQYVIEKDAPHCRAAVPLASDGKYVAIGVLGALALIGGASGGGGDHTDHPSSP